MFFTNTDKFRTAAIFHEKNGRYCNYPKGSLPYTQYWQEEDFKCRHGVTEDGLYIPGPFYFYLNYVQIMSKNEQTRRKTFNFPRFLDVDYDYFTIVEQARKEGKGVILTKPRRTGFSYKVAALTTWEYIFFKQSKSIIGAFDSKYSANTMGMVLTNLNFLDQNTEWIRPRNPDRKDYVMARHEVDLGGVKVWKGYMSSIEALTFKDNPFAAIGRTSSLFIWEEVGRFPNLIESYNITEPCWRDGEDMIGLPLLIGTGGDMEGGTRDFHEMFYNPNKYNLLAFDNIWDDNKVGTQCGWFVPATRGRLGGIKLHDKSGELNTVELVDKDGNSNQEAAKEAILRMRDVKASGLDSSALRDAITQFPLTPAESFLRSSASIFPTLEIQEHLSNIETSKELQAKALVGELYFDVDNKLKFNLDHSLKAINDFPIKAGDSKEGAVVIWEMPEADGENNKYGQYLAGCDPYDQDHAQYTDSLGSFFIYKTFSGVANTSNQIVAEYTARPEKADDFYETCRRLCIFYNAKCLYENQLKGLKNYFMHKNSLHFLYEQPNNMIKDIVKKTTVDRGYGIHMTKEIAAQCEIYLKQWLLTERTEINGKKILNLHTILSIPLLKELIAYDRERNCDRIYAFWLCLLQEKENFQIYDSKNLTMKKIVDTDPFFKRKLFSKRPTNNFFNT